jgi:hypothetical protein
LFDNPALFEHQDDVGPLHGGKPVGDDERCPADHELVQRLLDKSFAFGVEGRGRLVEDQDLRVFEDGAGDGDALSLATGEFGAAFARSASRSPGAFPL